MKFRAATAEPTQAGERKATTNGMRKPCALAPCTVALLLLLLVLPLLFAGEASAALPVRAAILYNTTTGQILYQKNADMPIPPASLTKIMTSFLVHDAIKAGRLSMRSKVLIPGQAARTGGSSMRLRSGERVPVRKLLEGMLIASGNDAATALAIKTGGSVGNFVASMNRKARQLGMRSTFFANPTGLPAGGQRTTARDLLRLTTAYMAAHPDALRIHSQSWLVHRNRGLSTTNPFLGERGVDGLKTGFTASSGYNIIVTSRRDGARLIAIVLGGRTSARRNMAGRALLDAGYATPTSPRAVQMRIDGRRGRTLKTKGPRAKSPKPASRKGPARTKR